MNASVLEISRGEYTAQFLGDEMAWGLGSIQPRPEYAGRQQELAEATLASIEPVAPSEMMYSCCTDGRCPLHLASGEPVPVREKLVGADLMIGFHMAETLGGRFYSDPNAPLESRLEEYLAFMKSKGTHVSCGMMENYVPVLGNIVDLSRNVAGFDKRVQTFVPADVYDPALAQQNVDGIANRLGAGLYEGYSTQLVMDVAKRVYGDDRAVSELLDDGRGVHGHVEELIVRLDPSVEGRAVNDAKLFEATDGRQVFSNNDARLARLARHFGRGLDTDYQIAYIAGEQATDGGHASLSKGLPTLRVALVA